MIIGLRSSPNQSRQINHLLTGRSFGEGQAGLAAWRQRGRRQRIVGRAYPLFPVPVTELDRPPQRQPFEVEEVSTARVRCRLRDRLGRGRSTPGRPRRHGRPQCAGAPETS